MKGVPVLFGYKMELGMMRIHEHDARIVQVIFESYIKGETLKQIADRLNQNGVPYKDGTKRWNKNIINRIIENERYCGNDVYPSVISKETFDLANSKKKSKASVKIEVAPVIEAVSQNIYCASCKSRFRREAERRKNIARWICRGGCKCSRKVTDAMLLDGTIRIINQMIVNTDLVKTNGIPTYQPNEEVAQLSKEITKMLHTRSAAKIKEMQFQEVKKKILQCASKKFDCCRVDQSGAVTDAIITKLRTTKPIEKEEDVIPLSDIVSKILVATDGTISVELINGKIVKELK